MKKKDKENLMHFITRMGMYISIEDRNNVISFITGYETGSNCSFILNIKNLLDDIYKINGSNGGWPNQISLFGTKNNISWIQAFKKIALEIIIDNIELDSDLSKILRTRIESLIHKINLSGDPKFNDSWQNEWIGLCLLENLWFKKIWNEYELSVIIEIDREVKLGNVFNQNGNLIPSQSLLIQKKRWDNVSKNI